jgi:predicted amidohydrolase
MATEVQEIRIEDIFDTDPADFFAKLYDALPEPLFRSDAMQDWLQEPGFWRTVDQITEVCFEKGRLAPSDLGPSSSLDPRHLVAIAFGLDEALTFANPMLPHYDHGRGMSTIYDRYLRTGSLSSNAGGALLPRRTYPGRPGAAKEKHHHFRCVRVPPRISWQTQYVNKTIPSPIDPHYSPGQVVTIGFVPLLESYQDIVFSFSKGTHGRARYSLKPKDKVADKLEDVLRSLDDSGVDIGVLPESALSDGLYDTWRQLLRSVRPQGRRKLRWILLGSGPLDGTGNTTVLVDRWTGREVFRQDKLADFTLTSWQFISWKLPDPPSWWDRSQPMLEDLRRDVPLQTLDTSLGRIGALICESLSRWPDSRQAEVIGSGVSHIFAPVFSKPMPKEGWEDQTSSQLATLVGSWVMVANSLAARGALDPGATLPTYSCLVAGPLDPDRASYRIHQQYGLSHLAEEVAALDKHSDQWSLEEGGPMEPKRPWVRAAQLRLDWFPELHR